MQQRHDSAGDAGQVLNAHAGEDARGTQIAKKAYLESGEHGVLSKPESVCGFFTHSARRKPR